MSDVAEAESRKAKKAVNEAQREYERRTADARVARRKVFQEAQEAGLTLREIGEQATNRPVGPS